MTPAEKIISDNNVCNRLTHWINACQQGNRIPAALITFGDDTHADSMSVIAPPEYPLPFLATLLRAALDEVEAEMVKDAVAACTVVRA